MYGISRIIIFDAFKDFTSLNLKVLILTPDEKISHLDSAKGPRS
jgi:hypothetical protein